MSHVAKTVMQFRQYSVTYALHILHHVVQTQCKISGKTHNKRHFLLRQTNTFISFFLYYYYFYYFFKKSTFVFRVSLQKCLCDLSAEQWLDGCLFPREVIIKTTFCYLTLKWRKKAKVCKSPESRMPDSHWLPAEDICMGTIGQVEGWYCDGCPLCKALCGHVGSFECFLITAPWAWVCIVNYLDELENVCVPVCM